MTELSSNAPMFIKLEKYSEVLSTISELKQFIQSLRYVFDIAEEAENIRNDAVGILRASLNRLERSVHEVDKGLVKPSGWTPERKMDAAQLSLERLQSQLSRLRKDIEYLGSERRTEAISGKSAG
ncbi:MAG: hypothetical protein HYW25_04795 [Candidatus Aenigmarchaeota archaeon]|nr:hypothetical protein [Candidatus Aenigmarchaeota archaeon]